MVEDKNKSVKKQLMYIKGEDYYFLTYNIIVLLWILGRFDEKAVFKDYRKLAFLHLFISDNRLISILELSETSGKVLSDSDRRYLMKSYSEGVTKINTVMRLLFALEQKGLVTISKAKGKPSIDVFLNKEALPEGYISDSLLKNEKANAKSIKKHIKFLSKKNFDTMLGELYDKHGVQRWQGLR